MAFVTRIVLDVLKPHHPSALEFVQAIAALSPDYQVHLTVIEMDENTETLQLEVKGHAIDFEAVQNTINEMGGSLHSIDEVEAHGTKGK